MYQLLSYGIDRLVISAHLLFTENSCELFRNSLHIGKREADTGTAFLCRVFGFVDRT